MKFILDKKLTNYKIQWKISLKIKINKFCNFYKLQADYLRHKEGGPGFIPYGVSFGCKKKKTILQSN